MAEASGVPIDPDYLLAALRASGASQFDPVRFRYLEAFARRAAAQAPAARTRLLDKLAVQVAALDACQRQAGRAATATLTRDQTYSPLDALLTHIARHSASLSDAKPTPAAGEAAPAASRANLAASKTPELKAISYFRQTWARLSTEQQLTQTLAHAPANAGPMNSQHLVLRALQSMQDISPDYLQAFMSHIDSLIWLEHADPTRPPANRQSGDSEKKRKTKKA